MGDPVTDTTTSNARNSAQHLDAIVIGAGFGGLYALYKLREIGLSAQGYTLAVLGSNKRFQLHTWAAQATPDPNSRGAKRIEGFELKPDSWYRMKLSVANEGDKAVARGKIWPREDKEPAEWMLTLEDATPNRTGSPGFFGNARDPASPFYLDNVVVKPNE